MKKLISVLSLLLVLVISSCTKEKIQQQIPSKVTAEKNFEEFLAKKNKGNGNNQAEVTTSSFTITSPGPNSVAYPVPPTDASSTTWVYTFIEYGSKDSLTGVWTKVGGISIWQHSWIIATGSPINPYVNGNGQIVNTIPTGTWDIRVSNYTATPQGNGYDLNSWKEYQSEILDDVVFQ